MFQSLPTGKRRAASVPMSQATLMRVTIPPKLGSESLPNKSRSCPHSEGTREDRSTAKIQSALPLRATWPSSDCLLVGPCSRDLRLGPGSSQLGPPSGLRACAATSLQRGGHCAHERARQRPLTMTAITILQDSAGGAGRNDHFSGKSLRKY